MKKRNSKFQFLVFAILNFAGLIGSQIQFNPSLIKGIWIAISILSLIFMVFLFFKTE